MEDLKVVTCATVVTLNAREAKNFAIAMTCDTNIFVVESQSGDRGTILIAQGSTGGYNVNMSAQFTVAMGQNQICLEAGSLSVINWLNVAGELGYSVEILSGKLVRKNQRYVLPLTGSKAGATSGFVVAAADNICLVTCPASKTASTLIVPVNMPLKIGTKITGFSVIGQVESAGNHVLIAAQLRKHTAVAADVADAQVAAQDVAFDVTADTIVSAANVGAANLTEVVAADETFYVLITVTTGASTDIALQGVTITVSEL
jgi:hypothetical protein